MKKYKPCNGGDIVWCCARCVAAIDGTLLMTVFCGDDTTGTTETMGDFAGDFLGDLTGLF